MSRTDPATDSESFDEIYRAALRRADLDSIHDVIVRHGPEILSKGLPYIIISAKRQKIDSFRKETRNEKNYVSEMSGPTPVFYLDPYEKIKRNQILKLIVDTLSELPDEDILVIWDHLEGHTDEEIQKKWKERGLVPLNPSLDLIRQRRHRGFLHLRELVHTRLLCKPQ